MGLSEESGWVRLNRVKLRIASLLTSEKLEEKYSSLLSIAEKRRLRDIEDFRANQIIFNQVGAEPEKR